jgi:hypothetical protein
MYIYIEIIATLGTSFSPHKALTILAGLTTVFKLG